MVTNLTFRRFLIAFSFLASLQASNMLGMLNPARVIALAQLQKDRCGLEAKSFLIPQHYVTVGSVSPALLSRAINIDIKQAHKRQARFEAQLKQVREPEIFHDAQDFTGFTQDLRGSVHALRDAINYRIVDVPVAIDNILGHLPQQGRVHGESIALKDISQILNWFKDHTVNFDPHMKRRYNNFFKVLRGGHAKVKVEAVPAGEYVAAVRQALLNARGRDGEAIATTLHNHVDQAWHERNQGKMNNLLVDLEQRLKSPSWQQVVAQKTNFMAHITPHIYEYRGFLPSAVAPQFGLRRILGGARAVADWFRAPGAERGLVFNIIHHVLEVHRQIDETGSQEVRDIADYIGHLLAHPEADAFLHELNQAMQDLSQRATEVAEQSEINKDLRELLVAMGDAWISPAAPGASQVPTPPVGLPTQAAPAVSTAPDVELRDLNDSGAGTGLPPSTAARYSVASSSVAPAQTSSLVAPAPAQAPLRPTVAIAVGDSRFDVRFWDSDTETSSTPSWDSGELRASDDEGSSDGESSSDDELVQLVPAQDSLNSTVDSQLIRELSRSMGEHIVESLEDESVQPVPAQAPLNPAPAPVEGVDTDNDAWSVRQPATFLGRMAAWVGWR